MKHLHRVLKPADFDKIRYWYHQESIAKTMSEYFLDLLVWFLEQFQKYTITIPILNNDRALVRFKFDTNTLQFELFTQLEIIDDVSTLLTEIQNQLDNLLERSIEPAFVPVKTLFDYCSEQYIGYVDHDKIYWIQFKRNQLSVIVDSVQELTPEHPYYNRKGLIWRTDAVGDARALCLLLVMLKDGFDFIAPDTIECNVELVPDRYELFKAICTTTNEPDTVKCALYPPLVGRVSVYMKPGHIELRTLQNQENIGLFSKDPQFEFETSNIVILLRSRIGAQYHHLKSDIKSCIEETFYCYSLTRSLRLYVNPDMLRKFEQSYERWSVITDMRLESITSYKLPSEDSGFVGPCRIYEYKSGWISLQNSCYIDGHLIPLFLIVFTPRKTELDRVVSRIVDENTLDQYRTWLVFDIKQVEHADRFRKALGDDRVVVIKSVKEYYQLLGHSPSNDPTSELLLYDHYVLVTQDPLSRKRVLWLVPKNDQVQELAEHIRKRKKLDRYAGLVIWSELTDALSPAIDPSDFAYSKPNEIRKVLRRDPQRAILSLEDLFTVLGYSAEASLITNDNFYQFVTNNYITGIIDIKCKDLNKQDMYNVLDTYCQGINTATHLVNQYLDLEQKHTIIIFNVDNEEFSEPEIQLVSSKTLLILHPGSSDVVIALIRDLSPRYIPMTICQRDEFERCIIKWLRYAFDDSDVCESLLGKILFNSVLEHSQLP